MVDLAKIRQIMDEARKSGLDEMEKLDRDGLLLTNRRLMQLRVESMEQVINLIGDIPAHQLLREAGHPGNLAEDYRTVLLAMLDDLAGKARQKWFSR